MSLAMRLMQAAMFKVSRSRHEFEPTVQQLHDNALHVGWDVPWTFELQQHYREQGLSDMTKVVNLYLCYPQGGYDIMKADVYKPMATMMPTAVSVYETSRGEVYVARMNLGRMSMMFRGTVRKTLREGGARLESALSGVVDT